MNRKTNGQFSKGNGLKNLTGMNFGRLTAIKISEKRSGRKTYWECKCDCGNTKVIRTDSLKDGSVKSCGCLKKEQDKLNLPKGQGILVHGVSKERIYHIWTSMISRCENIDNKSYEHYGGRGIKVCDKWHDVLKFSDWAMSNGYNTELTIDRIDVNGNYEPENCRWANWEEQANNKTTNVMIAFNGKTQTLMQWSKELEINYHTLQSRINYGIELPDLFDKESFIRKDNTLLTYNGKTMTMTSWANELGIKLSTLSERYRRGLSDEKIFYPGSLNGYKNKTTPR